MNREEIIANLREAMRGASTHDLDWDSIGEERSIESLGFDSLSILDLIYEIQQKFKIEFEAEKMVGIKTVGDLVDFLEKQMS